jgi:transposase InsO family protein
MHRNAKTTPLMRALIVDRIAQGWRRRDAARACGIRERTAAKWLARQRREGRAGLDDRSARPHRQPRRTRATVVAAIVAARHLRRPAWQIARQLQVPRSTVSAVLVRVGLNRLPALTPPPPVRRYERARVGELVHVDMKRLVRIGVVGHRIHGDRQRGMRGLGWETVHVCVDDYSRVAYCEVLPDQRVVHTSGFLERASRWFAQRGVRIERVMTDNGPSYCAHRFQQTCRRLGTRWIRTRPYRPQTNGKAERFIQTLIREWAYGTAYPTSAQRTRALRPWLRYDNAQRPHASLGYQSPASRLSRAAQ